MKKSRLLLLAGLVGLFLFSCSEELDIQPVEQDAATQMTSKDHSRAFARMSAEDLDVIDFEAFSKGDIVSSVYSRDGAGPVNVMGVNPRFPEQNAAMIFDSAVPSGGDPDLGTPHVDFGGPGVGVGGQMGSVYENNTALGKVLIITEDFDSNDPDDADLRESTFTFDFSELTNVSVYSMNIMDVEATENTATVKFYNGSDALIAQFGLPKVGDNGVHNYGFGEGVHDVAKMVVNLNGSGAIDNIVFFSETIVTPPPGTGCTFTQGYWKNHTKYSSAKRDDTWDKIGATGEDTPFFMSGSTYIEVMKTAPKGGNAYFILAHQYIAAKLNTLKGAYAPEEVLDAMAEAEAIFNAYTPAQIGALKGNDPLRQEMIEYATLLDRYNNGIIGPGHCDN